MKVMVITLVFTITLVYKVMKTQNNVHHVHPFSGTPVGKNGSRLKK